MGTKEGFIGAIPRLPVRIPVRILCMPFRTCKDVVLGKTGSDGMFSRMLSILGDLLPACTFPLQMLELLNMKGKHKHKWDYLREVLAERVVYDDMMHRIWYMDESMSQGVLFSCKQGQVNMDRPIGAGGWMFATLDWCWTADSMGWRCVHQGSSSM